MNELIEALERLLERGIFVDQTGDGVVIYLAPIEDIETDDEGKQTRSW